MNNEPDLQFDIDALFDHLVNDLEHDVGDELDWHFSFRSTDLEGLQQLADELESEFFVHVQEQDDEVDANEEVASGEPELIALCRGAFNVDQIKEMASRMQVIADNRGLTYAGVNCYEPIDEEELLGWLEPEDAGWRLRHMTSLGLEENADLPWAFLVSAPTVAATETIAEKLTAQGFDDRDDFSEADDEGNFGTCIFVAGRNNEAELQEATTKITTIAEAHGGQLYGIQFYTRDDVAEIFGSDGEEEEEAQ